MRVGGFYRAPRPRELRALVEPLERARELALEAVRFTGGLELPDFEPEHEFVALSTPDAYPLEGGRLVSTGGLDIAPGEYEEHFEELHVEHSTALHSRLRERGAYLVRPARALRAELGQLSPLAREAAAEAGLGDVCRNPFRSIVVRSVEIALRARRGAAADRRLRGARRALRRGASRAPGTGCGWTEAPRGLCWHRYRLDDDGTILEAKIVPPTSQNQASIEADLRGFLAGNLELEDDRLRHLCEQAIRNHDPCISCATHFLDPRGRSRLIVIGLGNSLRGDDAAGLAVARALGDDPRVLVARGRADRPARPLGGRRRGDRRRRRPLGRGAGHDPPPRRPG